MAEADKFYNPYQFIPVTGLADNSPRTVAFQDIRDGKRPDIRHDLWQQNLKSGRIVCSVHLETPTVVGNIHEKPDPEQETRVYPYKIGEEYALPASSLRGMIGAVAETLSQSALRVLEEERYSVRRDVGKGLSAIGCIRTEKSPDGSDHYFLHPLCLPSIPFTMPHQTAVFPPKWKTLFGEECSLADWLPAYVSGYDLNQASHTQNYKAGYPLHRGIASNHFSAPRYYYARLNAALQGDTVGRGVSIDHDALHRKDITRGKNDPTIIGHSMLGQKIVMARHVLTPEFYERKSPEEKSLYTRGVLYVLGIDGRENQIPSTKYHERFIPLPPDKNWKNIKLPIPALVIERFRNLAEARRKADPALPFLPQGYEAIPDRSGLLADGDMIYFDIDRDGEICEISYSSIWRRRVEGATPDSSIYEAFQTIPNSANLVPWGFGDRTHLTPAEYLLGVVDGKKREKHAQNLNSKNLASRVRFSDAFTSNGAKFLRDPPEPGDSSRPGQPGFQLPILASPKPPSPALYFQNGRSVTKTTLKLSEHRPNGRKIYLPHDPVRINAHNPPWVSAKPNDHRKQKSLCWPLQAGQTFYFHIDFENLTDGELHLLLTAINPGPDYLHRLGLGKPLGLGAVTVRSCGVFLIDRPARYERGALGADHRRYSSRMAGKWTEGAAARYPRENAARDAPEARFAKSGLVLVVKKACEQLCKAGSLSGQIANIPIRYPYCVPGDGGEDKGFQWFVSNDRAADGQRKALDPIPTADAKLTPLPTLMPP